MGNFAEEINSTFPDEWVKSSLNIIYTANWIKNRTEKEFSRHGISSQQFNILRILRGAKKAIKVSTVKQRMIEKSPNITRLMDKLCTKQFIRRYRSDNDRRTVFIEITDQGLKMLDSIDINTENFDLKSKITQKEAIELNRILDKLR